MGSFDIYCDVSGIGIGYGDDIIAFAIINNPTYKGYQSTWELIPIPFYGKYDDYGRIDFSSSSEDLAAKVFIDKVITNGDVIGEDDSVLNAILSEINSDNEDYLKIKRFYALNDSYYPVKHQALTQKINEAFKKNNIQYHNISFPLGVGTNLFVLKTSEAETEDGKNLVRSALNSIGYRCDIVKTSYYEEFLVYPDASLKDSRYNMLDLTNHENEVKETLNIALYIVRKDVFDALTKTNESIEFCAKEIKNKLILEKTNDKPAYKDTYLDASSLSNLNDKIYNYNDYFCIRGVIDRSYSDSADFLLRGLLEINPDEYPDEDIITTICKSAQFSKIIKTVMARDIQPQRSYRGTQCAQEAILPKMNLHLSLIEVMKKIINSEKYKDSYEQDSDEL
jgi:hypothetical protein